MQNIFLIAPTNRIYFIKFDNHKMAKKTKKVKKQAIASNATATTEVSSAELTAETKIAKAKPVEKKAEKKITDNLKPIDTKKTTEPEKKYNPFATFLKIVVTTVVSFILLSGGVCYGYYKVMGKMPFSDTQIVSIQGSEVKFIDTILQKNIKVNVLVAGTDESGMLTDVIFVINYDSATESVDILSIPRDTRISPSAEVKANFSSAGRYCPTTLKLNELHSYSGGKDLGIQNLELQIEDLLGISIDHYVRVSLDAFVAIVDAIGGVDMYVPQNMYWDMRDTGDILINLKEGYQTLDGSKAQQLIRYRQYPLGDVQRVEVQKEFLTAFAGKILSMDNIISNVTNLINVVYSHVDTNLSLSDALKYVNYVEKINFNRFTTNTIPGAGQYVGGVSYYIHDSVETAKLVDELFYQDTYATADATTSSATQNPNNSRGLNIEVSNGAGVAGLGGMFSETLANDGYTLLPATTYSGEFSEHTRIVVKADDVGNDLIEYFKDAQIEFNPGIVGTSRDIMIILGTSEAQ